MGFDNECILNIQSLAGEYFCPVCRTLVYPHEAVQTQCTHLYCKPCLSYVVSGTQACPYDGYLVTEAGSKPLMESNKALAETIGKTTVHCLYHRSGCVWQGPLSECTSHCSGCTFGNSPVVCNRCGIQIVHRQVQEHAQTCNVNGTNTQSQQGAAAQDAATSAVTVSTDQTKTANQAAASNSQPQAPHTATGPGPSTMQNVNQPASVNPLPQPVSATAVPTPDQQYYQQYQQYYQQYPGYDPYQQGYQQYYPYQQPPAQTQSQPQLQQQVQTPMQLQSQVQPPPVRNNQPPQAPVQGPPQISSNGQPQPLYPPPVVVGSGQIPGQVNPQPQAHPGHMPPQPYSQAQTYPVQNNTQPQMQPPPYQQPYPQMQPPPYPQAHPPFQPHFQAQTQYPPVQPIGGPPTYQSQSHQPIPQAPPQQHPMQVQPSGPPLPPQMPPQMRPPQLPHMLIPQQRPIIQQVQQPMGQQYMQQPQVLPIQTSGPYQSVPYNAGPFAQQQVRPLGPPGPPQPPVGYAQPQLGTSMPHGLPPHPSQSYVQPQPAMPHGMPPYPRPPQFDSRQPSVNPSNVNTTNQADHRLNQQEDKSPSMKKLETVGGDFVTNFNEVKHETGVNDERILGNGCEDDQRKDETLTKDAVSESHHVQGETSKNKEEKSQNKTEDGGVATLDSVKQGETSKNFQGSSEVNNNGNFEASGRDINQQSMDPHPPVPYGLPGQQQRPTAQAMGQPVNNMQPSGPGYLPYGSHQGEHFQPPGPNQPSQLQPFHPEPSFGGPPGPGPNNYPNNRGYEQQPTGHVRQGDPFGPPYPHGPNVGHPGSMESDMFRNQMPPPHFDSRRPDSHLPGNVDREPYGQSFGPDSSSMRMNGPPQGHESGPTRHHDQGPPRLDGEGSPKFGRYPSRPMGGYGMDGPSRFLDRDSDGYGYRSNDNRGRFDNNHHNPDFGGPMHGFGRHNMDRMPHNSPGNASRPFGGPHNLDIDNREMERHPYGDRFAMGPPGHMHRGEFDGPVKPRGGEPFGPRNMSGWGEPGPGSFQDYGRREPNGSGPFSHQPPFGESSRSHMGEPGFRSNYSRQGFANDGGFYPGGPDSFDQFRKRKTLSMGWCRICKVDCESVEGLDMHGQTREHQRMTMDMVINIKKNNTKKLKTSSDHSSREDASKFRQS